MFHFALGKLGAAIRAGTGSAGVVPLFSRDYEATGSLGADATFTRASTATVTDFEDLVKIAKSGEARFEGLRRVENLIYHSEDLTLNAAVVSAGVSATSTEITFTNTTGEYRKNVNTTKTHFIVRVTFKARRISGDGTQIKIDYGNIRSWNFDIDDNLTRYSTMFSGNLTGTTNWVDFKLNNGTGLVLEVTEIQVEDVTGQTNQNPSEYVSVGVLSAPYHGANVDGVKYFATENGNTVTDDVVTEGTGAAITGGALLMEPAATNYLLNSGTPATQTTGSLGTGNYVLWVEGSGSAAVTAGTATITGGGTATDGTPDTFTVTGAGTVTVTVTGTLDRFQLEAGSIPTSYIPTSGSAVTRAADALSYPLTTPQTEGMAIVDLALPSGVVVDKEHGFIGFRSASRTSLIYKNATANLLSYDTTTTNNAGIFFDGAEQTCILANRWGSGTFQVGGNSDDGGWTWALADSYDGSWQTDSIVGLCVQIGFPVLFKKAAIYDADQGTDWIEANS